MLETLQAKYRHRYVAQEKMSPDDSQRVASSLAQKLGHYSRPDPRNKGAMDELSNTMDITSPDFFFGSKK
jgi:hypothetical protein